MGTGNFDSTPSHIRDELMQLNLEIGNIDYSFIHNVQLRKKWEAMFIGSMNELEMALLGTTENDLEALANRMAVKVKCFKLMKEPRVFSPMDFFMASHMMWRSLCEIEKLCH
jgi:hypothetical protein